MKERLVLVRQFFVYNSRVNEFSLMQYTGMMLLEEMASIFLTPYLLIFIVPEVIIQDLLYFFLLHH